MAQSCFEFLDWATLQTILRYGSQWQGNLGEQIANLVCKQIEGFTPTQFKPSHQGIDGIFEDADGNLVVVEAKSHSDVHNPNTMLSGKGDKKQLIGKRWLPQKAKLMQQRESSYYAANPDNAILGRRIQEALEHESGKGPKIRKVLVHANPATGDVTVYEYKDGRFEVISGFNEKSIVVRRGE